jgi:hypothetical protein
MVQSWEASGLLLFQFLSLKLRQTCSRLAPCLRARHQAHNSLHNLVLAGSDLRRRVAVAKSDRSVLQRLEVDRDAKRRPQLVIPRVPLACESLDHIKPSKSVASYR